jgi:hypothetical protein
MLPTSVTMAFWWWVSAQRRVSPMTSGGTATTTS